MDAHRAKEILHSSEKIGVQYQGEPVWIESVNSDNDMVQVQLGENEQKTVAANELHEVE